MTLRWAGHVVRMGAIRTATNILVETPKGKRPVGRLGHKWKDNIKINLKDVCVSVDWI
jgi:hypothetical protein